MDMDMDYIFVFMGNDFCSYVLNSRNDTWVPLALACRLFIII